MNVSPITLQRLIKQGNVLVSEIPKKLDYATVETKIHDKYSPKRREDTNIQKQLQLLWSDYNKRVGDATQKYKEWFRNSMTALQALNDDSLISNFKSIQANLGMDARIKSGVVVLNNALEKIHAVTTPKTTPIRKSNWKTIIEQGEGEFAEFKSSLLFDFKSQQKNKNLPLATVKTIAAFLNSKGGTLFIGVTDQQEIIGLEKDYALMRKQNADGLIQYLLQQINFHIGKAFNHFISITVAAIDSKEICVIRVLPSDKPAFVTYDNNEVFYIRASLSSQPLNVREATEYINMHWK